MNMLLYQILALITFEKNIGTKIMNLKYQFRHGMKSLNYLIDHILLQIFKTILKIPSENGTVSDIPSLSIYLNKIKKRNTFKLKQDIILNFYRLKQRNYLELLKLR